MALHYIVNGDYDDYLMEVTLEENDELSKNLDMETAPYDKESESALYNWYINKNSYKTQRFQSED